MSKIETHDWTVLHNYLEGIMPSGEQAKLKERLKNEPELRKTLAELVYQHRLLVDMRAETCAEWASEADEDSEERMPNTLEERTSTYRFGQTAWKLALAAGLLVAVGLGWWRFGAGGLHTDDSETTTDKQQRIVLRFDGEDTVVDVAKNTKLTVIGASVLDGTVVGEKLLKTGPEKVIQLESGSIKVSVAKQTDGRSFMVRSKHAEMTALGTRFSVAALEDRTRLIVEEGKVGIRSSAMGSSQYVESGEVAVMRKGAEVASRPGKMRQTLDVKAWGLGTPKGVAFDGKLVWLYMQESETLTAMDPETMGVVKQVKVEQPFVSSNWGASGLAWDGKLLWGWCGDSVLRSVDPETGKTVRDLKLQFQAGNMPFDVQDGVLWICQGGLNEKDLLRVDMNSGTILQRISIHVTGLADSMASAPGISFLNLRRQGVIAVSSSEDGRLLYTVDIHPGGFNLFGGDVAYDEKRGMWCCSGKTMLALVEME